MICHFQPELTKLCCTISDSTATRALAHGTAVTGQVTIESCTTACQNSGYPLAGAEYATECCECCRHSHYVFILSTRGTDCGATLDNGSGPTPASDCNMACAGNSSEYCGGPNRLNLYNYTGTLTTGGGSTGGPSHLQSGLPGNWTYGGCYVDNAHGRVLGNEQDSNTMTVESCISYCSSSNFTIAGIEYGTQCCGSCQLYLRILILILTSFPLVCGNYLVNGATKAPESECNMACGGNSSLVFA